MPSKNEACTATITEILDKDDDRFKTKVYGEHDILLEEVEHLTYEEMERLNGDDRVRRISVVGDIPFVESGSTSLMLVDTPGPNNSRDESHKEATYRALPLTYPRSVPLYGAPAREGRVTVVITCSKSLGRLGLHRSGLMSIRFTGRLSQAHKGMTLRIMGPLGLS